MLPYPPNYSTRPKHTHLAEVRYIQPQTTKNPSPSTAPNPVYPKTFYPCHSQTLHSNPELPQVWVNIRFELLNLGAQTGVQGQYHCLSVWGWEVNIAHIGASSPGSVPGFPPELGSSTPSFQSGTAEKFEPPKSIPFTSKSIIITNVIIHAGWDFVILSTLFLPRIYIVFASVSIAVLAIIFGSIHWWPSPSSWGSFP
ncbi:hypothetical protein HOY82DRAFT_542809 [Tuber indicum]|nr:hypothetical protein HOY82DRAFT_542809 [Tuber indicum]